MALKMDRQIDAVEVGYFVNTVTERGLFVSVFTNGSGVALDNPSNVATVNNVASGSLPLGCLLNDFVNLDLTRTPINWMKDQSQIGNKATILTKGWVVTNKVNGTPVAGDDAVLDASGFIKPFAPGFDTNVSVAPRVGRFRTGLDESGYARVYVDL